MRLTFYSKIGFAVLLLVCVNSARGGRGNVAAIWPDPLLGTWINRDPATNGLITKLIISKDSRSGTGIWVVGFSTCMTMFPKSPTPCPEFSGPATLYSVGVSSPAAVAFKIQDRISYKTVTAGGYLKGQYLEVETFIDYTDGSGKYNSHFTDQLVRPTG